MKEKTNYSKLERIFETNGGFITRANVDEENIPSWFLSDYVKRNKLVRIAPGFYADESYVADEYNLFQRRYPKYVFSGLSALYLLGLTDKIPTDMEVGAPQSYHPSRIKRDDLIIRKMSNYEVYQFGVKECQTMFGNTVRTYDEERTICDLIKYRDRYDSETFVKAIRAYIKMHNNQTKLFEYARRLGVEKKVYEVVEILANAD